MKVDQTQHNHLASQLSPNSALCINEPDYFMILKNHRQSCIRKYLRKIRKQTQQEKKVKQAERFQKQKSQRNGLLNYNMLKQEYLWQILIDYEKGEYNSQTHQSGYEVRSKQEIGKQFVKRLAGGDKQSLWLDEFVEFKYVG